jgi:hypothetical protein
MFPSRIPSSPIVKSTVKASFEGRSISVCVAALIPLCAYYSVIALFSEFSYLMSGLLAIIPIVMMVLSIIFIVYPILLGAIRFFWRITDGAKDEPESVFYYFESSSRYKRAVKSSLWLAFKCFVAFFTAMLPYILITLLSNAWVYQFLGTEIPLWVAKLELVRSFLQMAGIFAGITVISRYYLFPALVVMDDGMLLLEAMHISVMISRRSVAAFLSLVVSLFGWILLSVLVVPMLYTAPLFLGCYVVHCRYAVVNYNLSLEFYAKDKYTIGF